jgi:hypothetical protein
MASKRDGSTGARPAKPSRKDGFMFRTLIAAAAVYAYGHPAFDAMRPAVLDKPLQVFYSEINLATQDSKRALGTLDGARKMQYLNVYVTRIDKQLRAAE